MRCLDFLFRHSKCVIYILYFTLMCYGIALVIWGVIDRLVLEKLPPGTFGIWVGVGLLSMLNASLGLHGTRIEDPYLVYASIILLFVTCVSQILVTIIKITIPFISSTKEKERLQALFDSEEEEWAKEFSRIESSWGCCGVTGYNDYEEKFDPLLVGYPESCCNSKKRCSDPEYKIGCHQTIMRALQIQELVRALIFLFFSIFKFFSAIIIAILTMWYDEYYAEEP